jgi:hypothetical protein
MLCLLCGRHWHFKYHLAGFRLRTVTMNLFLLLLDLHKMIQRFRNENLSPMQLCRIRNTKLCLLNFQLYVALFLFTLLSLEYGDRGACKSGALHNAVALSVLPYSAARFFCWDLFSVPCIELKVSFGFQSDFVTWFKCTREYFDCTPSPHRPSTDFSRCIPIPHNTAKSYYSYDIQWKWFSC